VGVLVGVLQTKIIQRTAKPNKIGPIQCSSLLKHVNKSSRFFKNPVETWHPQRPSEESSKPKSSVPKWMRKAQSPKACSMHQELQFLHVAISFICIEVSEGKGSRVERPVIVHLRTKRLLAIS
jgi:hypothetical protein